MMKNDTKFIIPLIKDEKKTAFFSKKKKDDEIKHF